MAKRGRPPKALLVENVEGEEPEAEEQTRIDPEQVEDANRLSEFLEHFGGKEYKVRVDKFNKDEKFWEHIDTFPVDGFEPYETCKRFGGGRYRMTFLNEKGKYVPGGQPQLRIAGVAAPAAAIQAQSDNDPLKHPVVAMMLASAERAQAQTTELLKAVLARPEPAKSSTTEVLELMERVKRMSPEDPMKRVSEALMMKMIEKGLDGGSGDHGDKSTWQEIIEGLKDAKEMGIFDKLLPNRAPAGPRPNPKATSSPEVRVQLPLQQEEPPAMPKDPMSEALRPYAVIFKSKAENGVEVLAAASYLVDEFYESVIPLIRKNVMLAKFMSDQGIIEYAIGAANDAEQIEKLFAFAPELAPHRDWTLAVIAKAVELVMTPEGENAAEPDDKENVQA